MDCSSRVKSFVDGCLRCALVTTCFVSAGVRWSTLKDINQGDHHHDDIRDFDRQQRL